MNNRALDQKYPAGFSKAANMTAKVQRRAHTSIPEGSILEGLWDFTFSIPDFRRTGRGNIRHVLGYIIILMIFARISQCDGRTDMIEYGKYNLHKFQSMNLLKNGVPSEPTLCRVENGIDDSGFADKMAEFVRTFHRELVKACDRPEMICIDGKAMRGTVQKNGRNPDIISVYSPDTGITLATEACEEKSNEIKAVPLLLDKIGIAGKLVTADAMSMQKDIINKIRKKNGYFLIELKANQRALRYGVEDKIRLDAPRFTYSYGPELEHGRIETRLYVANLPVETSFIGKAVRKHWSIESMHWGLDVNLLQDSTKRKLTRAARNLGTLQRIVYSLFSVWKGRRKKLSDKAKGVAELMRFVAKSFTKLRHFLSQK